ncbi:intein C-terminal splicing domain protein [Leptospira interrogans serovar Australis str. 200703203]|uniref:Intein C-terminal splicing domain protein n=1 Tax=Leptospira interrogans serovar Australis str. 200703203 TaxID=1085541 RepID=N1UE00_LEPIR|nr:intein C-terminal splicing domain protein [Leptospira interrogans serovar Australis str. 200703203]
MGFCGEFANGTCFVANTLIQTKDGLKAIEKIQVGDVVRSWNENTNQFENKRVTETFVHEVPQLFFLELDGEEEIHVTWNHPFRRRTTSAGNVTSTETVPPFEPRGIQRTVSTHEHTLQPRTASSLVGSPDTKEGIVLAFDEKEAPHLTPNQLAPNVSKFLTSIHYSAANTVSESEWAKVEDLKLNDEVLKSDGSWGRVTGIYYYNTEPTKVYNLEVEDNHTYIVGGKESASNAGYVVHNYSKEHEAMFSKVRSVSKDMFDVAKQLAGLEGGTGNEVYQRAVKLDGEVKATNALRDVLKTESNALVVKREAAQAGLELVNVRNSEFLKAIRDPKSDNIPGIAELRKQLKGVNPERGFSQSEMKSVSGWMSSNGLGQGLGKTNLGFGGGVSGGADSRMKGYIVSTALSIASSEEHGRLTSSLKDSNEKLAQHKIKEDNIGRQLLERSNAAKADLVKLVQERHGNDPKYAEVLVEHGLVKRDSFEPNEHKVTYDEKLKSMGDKIKPDTQKKLAEYDRKITDLRVSQNKHEAESYAQWNKDHPNESYKRTPEMEKRRNDMIAMQGNLEKERATIINREVAPFTKENELHRLEKLSDANGLSEKQKTELTNLRNEKKAHESQVAALLDRDPSAIEKNLDKLLGKPEPPKDFKAVVKEADTRKSYDKYMGLSQEQINERSQTMAKEYEARDKTEIAWKKSNTSMSAAESDLKRIDANLSKLNTKSADYETKKTSLEEQRKTAQEKVSNIARDHKEYEEQKNKAFETVNKREERESKELITKLGNQNLDKIEKDIAAKKKELAEVFLNDSKNPDKKVKELTKEITKLNTQKDELNEKMAVAIKAIDDRNKSSDIVIGTLPNDLLPDHLAKFMDPVQRKMEWVEKNLAYIKDELYAGENVEYTVSGSQAILEEGVINLGTAHSNQFVDYGATVKIISDSDKSMFGNSNGLDYNEKTGKYEYVQSGRNTCQSYSFLEQLLYIGVLFRDSGRSPIHELAKLQYNLGLTAEMSTNTAAAYTKLLEPHGMKTVTLGDGDHGVAENFANIKAALKRGEIVNAGMYIDGPVNGEHRAGYDKDFNKLKPSKGHRVDIIGFDDKRGEWIVNDSARPNQMIRYKYNDYELGHRWSMVIRKK